MSAETGPCSGLGGGLVDLREAIAEAVYAYPHRHNRQDRLRAADRVLAVLAANGSRPESGPA